MIESEIRMWAANTACQHCGSEFSQEKMEKLATRLFAFVALGAFDVPYLPASKLSGDVRPISVNIVDRGA